MKHFDVVVIGAGNGGLAAACKIALAGKSVLLCEKHNIPGGFATSFVRGRFEFEASLHELNSVGTPDNLGSCGRLFKECGVLDKIKFYQIKNCYRLISKEEGIDFTMPVGEENIINACKNLCPDAEKYTRQFLDLSKNCAEAMTYLGQCHGRPDPEVLKTKYGGYLIVASYSVNEVFDAIKIPKILRDIFTAYWSYLGTDFNNLSFIHYANMVYKYFTLGAVVPSLRSHEMSLALANRIHELGGHIYFNTEVTNILTDDNGAVRAVRLKNGEEILTRHVIADCSPHTIYSKMLDKVPEKALKLTNFRKFSGRGFTVFLGLNKSPEELGITDHSYFVYSCSDSVRTFNEMRNLNHTAGQATVCLNHVVPDASPKGTTILYMTTLFTSDCWKEVKVEDYYKFKNSVAKRFIKQFEDATHVNLHDHIEEIAIATPFTYARYCAHPQGNIYGYLLQYNDNIMARAQMVKDDAIVKGLRIGGGYGERSLGFSSSYVSGANEALRTLDDISKEAQ